MHASSRGKNNGLAERANAQLDLFNHSVCDHTVAAKLLCTHHAPKTRCMMNPTPKPTYSQEWSAYNQAQTNEKAKFLELLFELCKLIIEPPQGMGRPRAPLADLIFASCLKIYSGLSGRRNQSDLREALQRGYLSRPVHYNTISKYLEREDLTGYLKDLIVESSLPLKDVELDFAVDSSGCSTGVYQKWVHAKWGKAQTIKKEDWIKVHIMCGVKTNIITAIEVTHAHAGDSPQFGPLVEKTSENFLMNSVCADKAYSSSKNLQLTLVKGAQPYIAFKSNATANSPSNRQTSVWKRMFHLYSYNQAEFMRHYHKRSNVETTFSMIKRKFGERLRAKTPTAQVNEVLCKVLAHNLCCVIQSMYELGIEPQFWSE